MLEERRIHDIHQVENLIRKCGLTVHERVDYTVGLFESDNLIATGSLVGDMIQMVAVLPDRQGEDLTSRIVTHLLQHAFEKGIRTLCLFTKPDAVSAFLPLGFNTVAIAKPYTALMEWGKPGIAEYCAQIRALAGEPQGKTAALVMNCNPFTLGHRFLVETAAKENDRVVILAVQEDLSVFPFDVRYRLIKEGTADLSNVVVVPGGRYTVSSLTFPSYFTRDTQLAYAQTAIDVEIFLRHIVPTLGISRRYIGTEPFSPVTEIYNQAMKERLTPAGVEVIEITRAEKANQAISASRVRALLTKGELDAVRELVPTSTYRYLTSDEAIPVIERLRALHTLH